MTPFRTRLSRSCLLALLAGSLPPPAVAARAPAAPPRSAEADFVRARAADELGQLDVAAAGYAAALAANPGDTMLALRTFRQAIIAGDMPLAVRTAQALDAKKSLPPDGAIVLVADAILAKDQARATALADRLERDKLFAFLAPTMRAWIAFGARDGDPLAKLPIADVPSRLALTYAAEHRPLLLIATGKTAEGIAAFGALSLDDGARAARLRIAMAATLAARREKAEALALLGGGDAATVRARAAIMADRKVHGAIDTAAAGIGELLVRVAADINRQQAGPLAVEFARVSTWLAPDGSESWLVTANLLGSAGDSQAGIDALAHVAPDDPFIGAARDLRFSLLGRLGASQQALAEAQAATAAKDATAGDWARLADLYDDKGRFREAGDAYGRALALAGGDKANPDIAWPLLLQQANALLQAGDWPAAKEAALHALALSPQQPALLNFLGYSKLERGEDIASAGAMIAQASALAPQDSAITDSLGWSWYLRGDLDRAIPLLERAARGAPAEADINEHLGDAYWRAGRRLEARYAWRAALVVADPDVASRLRTKIDYGETGKP